MTSQAIRHRPGLAIGAEHYLRAILELREERGYARVVDIATRVGVTKGSVSIALGQLEEKGLVRFDAARFPVLTASGRRIAHDVRGRYRIVHMFLTDVLGFPTEQASAEACRWEHVISHDAADRLLDFIRFAAEEEPEGALLDRFRNFHRTCSAGTACTSCAVHGPVDLFCIEPPGKEGRDNTAGTRAALSAPEEDGAGGEGRS